MTLQTVRPAMSPRRADRGLTRVTGAVADLFTTPHGADRFSELINPLWVRNEIRGRVVAARQQTMDTVSLTVRTNRAWPGFTAGQSVGVSVEVDGVLQTRYYSPAGSQHGPARELEFTIRVNPGGVVSPVLAATVGQPGLVLRLTPPRGTFTLPTPRPDRLLLLSGGSGITPVMSMLRTLVDEGHQGKLAFLHYADDADDVPYREELEAIQRRRPDLDVVLAYTAPGAGGGLPGLFTGERLAAAVPWYFGAHTYLCGPPPLAAAVQDHFRVVGLLDRLHVERFTLGIGPISADDAASGGTITFRRSGISVADDGSTLLEQAERAGLDGRRGCGMGICFRCVQVKHSGRVHNVISGRDHDDPDEEVQICVGVPVGDVELDL